jgi:uncharacterized protein involved in exopolysaccharide biosynthesis
VYMTKERLSEARVQKTETAVFRATLLWGRRALLGRVAIISFVAGLAITFSIPKQYKSTARIMPPDQQGSGAMMLAALASHSTGLGALGNLAGGLLGGHTSAALYIDLFRSSAVTSQLIQHFELQHVYRKRYLIDTAKRLAKQTSITDDKKSGVITIEVEDTDPARARDLAQGYLDELNKLLAKTSTSSAHLERVFIEGRLHKVEGDLEQAQLQLSEFSSNRNTIDIKEQTHAMVDAGARLQAEMLVAQSGLQSLRQLYGDSNVRVRQTEARIASLNGELNKMTGTSAALPDNDSNSSEEKNQLYPPLRQLPRLAVPYADLYRKVRVQEAVFELLTQQYELARVQEAKDIPVVSVIDAPGIPEKKSYPHRGLLTLALTLLSVASTAVLILIRHRWENMASDDEGKVLITEIYSWVIRFKPSKEDA